MDRVSFRRMAVELRPAHCTPSAPTAIQNMQKGSGKMIDFIFGVSYFQHWHDINLTNIDRFGAGVYFHPYITVNGTMIKYGVVNLDTLCRDLTQWDTMYLAGRLQKPVKILRDHPKVRLANQMNLLSALRVALLLLPERFSEFELYSTIAGMSYMGDLRMALPAEDPASNEDWIDDPNAILTMAQDMDPVMRGNVVRRLPESFRQKLYFQYQSRYQIPRADFNKMIQESKDSDEVLRRPQGGSFERRIAGDDHLQTEVSKSIEKTIRWPSTVQTIKAPFTAGLGKSWTYLVEKRDKHKKSQMAAASALETPPWAKKPTQAPKSSEPKETKKE
ncbi:Mitochondrial matrix Mmp37 [Penicillium expansum]|nr:Mitochondrial matrix Mmp37 [Penicillium expansum]